MQHLRWTDGAQKIAKCVRNLIRFKPVKNPISIPAFRDQVRIFQDGEMPRDGWPGDREAGRDLPRRQFAFFQLLQNLAPGRVGQRAECFRHRFHTYVFSSLAN